MTGTHPPLLAQLERGNVNYLWVSYHDYSGRASAKTIPQPSMWSAVEEGVAFAKANLNMDANDRLVEGATLLANSGDIMAVPDPRSFTTLPRFPGIARTHAYLREPDGTAWNGCPRTRLDTIAGKLRDEGFSVRAALEPEFTLFYRLEDEALAPINRFRTFSQEGWAKANAFIGDLMIELAGMGINVAQLGKGYGADQYGLSIEHGAPMAAVDRYLHLRSTIHDMANIHGLVATLMPKPYAEYAGNGLHVHMSLWNGEGTGELTPSSADDISLSDVGMWFIGGLLAHAAALTAIGSPTVNSYKRLQPGSWSPVNSSWGYGNRSCLIRIPGVGSRRRIEYRSPDNTTQPYLLLCALLAAGLDGIKRQIDPGPPFEGDAGHVSPDEIAKRHLAFLPRTLPEALAALEDDELVCAALGSEILKHFLVVKRGELETYNSVVHEWERSTYLELH